VYQALDHDRAAKLDELLKVTREARTELAQIDEEEPEDIEKIRNREKSEADTSSRQSAA
jgi:low affinity Fe/Cu permease